MNPPMDANDFTEGPHDKINLIRQIKIGCRTTSLRPQYTERVCFIHVNRCIVFWAREVISGNKEMSPSMLKTPSVDNKFKRIVRNTAELLLQMFHIGMRVFENF